MLPVRILHILDHSIPLHSGYTFRTRSILREQHRRGWETVHLTSAKQGPAASPAEEVDGLTFYRTSPTSNALNSMPVLRHRGVVKGLERRLLEVIADTQPDVLHAHSPALNGLAAIEAGRRTGVPVLYECRAFWEDAAVDHGTSTEGGLRYRLSRALETRVFRKADAVTTICEGLRRDIASRGIDAGKVTVIPNAVDIERFPFEPPVDEPLRERLQLGPGPVLGFIGSFYAYEGLDLLVAALPALHERFPELRVLLVGGGNEAAALKDQCRRLAAESVVAFVGRVPHDEVGRYYGLVDMFVYPRKSMRLTELVTPLKPLESMAQGKLVAASDVGGHRELIRDGETGFLFPADDAAALAAHVAAALEHPERWQAIRRAARHYVETERTWQVSVARYADIYHRLVATA